jgi:hypothetical protein
MELCKKKYRFTVQGATLPHHLLITPCGDFFCEFCVRVVQVVELDPGIPGPGPRHSSGAGIPASLPDTRRDEIYRTGHTLAATSWSH